LKSQVFLKSPLDFKRVLNEEEVFYGKYFIVKKVPNSLGFGRFGIIASKKTGTAVTRNHIKRLVREVMKKQSIGPYDIVLIAKRTAVDGSFHNFNTDICRILTRAALI